MALLVLLSTISWSVDKHLCMGRVMDISFFSPAKDCGMEAAFEAFEEKENHCCDDESFTLVGQEDLKLALNDFELEQLIFFVAFTYTYAGLGDGISVDTDSHEIYPPPLLIEDLTVLYETYLI